MGRPRTPLLDKDRIALAALRQIDRKGDFTIPELAHSLKVSPASLYHHVDGRAEILTLVRQYLARTVDATAFGHLPWDDALRAWAQSYRDTFASHAGAVALMSVQPVTDPVLHRMYDAAVAALEDAGFPQQSVLAVITAVESFVLGSALDLVAPEVMVADVDSAAQPRLAAAVAITPSGRPRADQAFHLGLDALLTGIGSLRTQRK